MAIILKANKVNLFVSSVLFVFWYHSPNFLDTPSILLTFQLDSVCCLQGMCGQFELLSESGQTMREYFCH
jgi:hypothetical protein